MEILELFSFPFSLTSSEEKCACAPIIKIGDPVLRTRARALSKNEILTPEIQQLIAVMKETMRSAPGVGLAAPQIGLPLQIAVVEDMDHSHLTEERRKEIEREPTPFHVMINPILTIEEEEKASFTEGCLSIDDLLATVPRAKKVRVECLDENANPVVIHAKGWHARILKHEVDHLNGILFCDRADLKTLASIENYQKFWK